MALAVAEPRPARGDEQESNPARHRPSQPREPKPRRSRREAAAAAVAAAAAAAASPSSSDPASTAAPALVTPCDPWPRPYFFLPDDNLRRVRPYHFTYNTWCKQRWRDREIFEVFVDEFRDRPAEYYARALETGTVLVNGAKVSSPRQIVRNGDLVSHTMHRHEPPVSAQAIGVVHEDDDVVVIDKPAGIPVHPAGRYNFNSIVEIMRAQRGLGFTPLPANRLDRLTSGVMFIAKHRAAAEKLTEQLMARTVKKEYVARVRGRFPDGDVVCDQPILQISPKLGLNRVRAGGKTARTVFRRLAYYPPSVVDGSAGATEPQKQGYSIVRCRPLTGRTHQLRVHLQFLGHPITNDPIYANQRVWGAALGKGDELGADDEDVLTRLARMGKEEVASAVAYHDELVDDYNRRKAERLTGEVCHVCGTELYSDPGEHELGIYLHAKKYADADGAWVYETPLPQWALPPEGVEGPSETTAESDPLAIDVEGELGIPAEQAVKPAV